MKVPENCLKRPSNGDEAGTGGKRTSDGKAPTLGHVISQSDEARIARPPEIRSTCRRQQESRCMMPCGGVGMTGSGWPAGWLAWWMMASVVLVWLRELIGKMTPKTGGGRHSGAWAVATPRNCKQRPSEPRYVSFLMDGTGRGWHALPPSGGGGEDIFGGHSAANLRMRQKSEWAGLVGPDSCASPLPTKRPPPAMSSTCRARACGRVKLEPW